MSMKPMLASDIGIFAHIFNPVLQAAHEKLTGKIGKKIELN